MATVFANLLKIFREMLLEIIHTHCIYGEVVQHKALTSNSLPPSSHCTPTFRGGMPDVDGEAISIT